MRNLTPVRTEEASFNAFTEELDRLDSGFANNTIGQSEFERRIKTLLDRFAGKVFVSDMHLFDSGQEFYDFLVHDYGISEDTALRAIGREKGHFTAESPATQVKYGCWMYRMDKSESIGFRPFVYFETQTKAEYRETLIAMLGDTSGKNLSEYDKRQKSRWR